MVHFQQKSVFGGDAENYTPFQYFLIDRILASDYSEFLVYPNLWVCLRSLWSDRDRRRNEEFEEIERVRDCGRAVENILPQQE